jgi:O-6-methylguanine DNA methyltransferase
MKSKTNSSFALPIETAEGTFVAGYSESGLAALRFPDDSRLPASKTQRIPRQIQDWHRETSRALMEALSGKEPQTLPPLDLSHGSAFQQQVWRALRKIATGTTLSYSEVAGRIGRPNAVRAVGGACGANPIPVLVPCHRVLAANHRLGGFSGGLNWKRTLLAREGLSVR